MYFACFGRSRRGHYITLKCRENCTQRRYVMAHKKRTLSHTAASCRRLPVTPGHKSQHAKATAPAGLDTAEEWTVTRTALTEFSQYVRGFLHFRATHKRFRKFDAENYCEYIATDFQMRQFRPDTRVGILILATPR